MSVNEATLIRKTVRVLKDHGWAPKAIRCDGGDYEELTPTEDEIVKASQGIDDFVTLVFEKDGKEGGILYVPGNGEDWLSDCTSNLPDAIFES